MARHKAFDLRAQSREVEKVVKITEYRCVICGKWFRAKRPANTCCVNHRVQLNYLDKRGRKPRYMAFKIIRMDTVGEE